jgi:protein-L-isoaspartate(D-aspartate) O-methyltransferase
MREPTRRDKWPPHWSDITDPAVLAALADVPRHLFVPADMRGEAYDDVALPIGCGQTISQPYIVALMTQALGLTPQSRVLDVGTGSGYQAAILAHITPNVWGVEAAPELAEAAQARLTALGLRVAVRVGDGRMGWPEHAPYDGITVGASAAETPPALVAQLADPGRLVIPLGDTPWDQRLWLIEKSGGRLAREYLGDVRFVPLIETSSGADVEDGMLADIRQALRRLFGR